MTPPLVSVIIPAYNAERWLPETIDSVVAQTHPAIEVIVVDDGSSDRTLMVAQECMDPRVRVLRQANAGPGSARNHGLQYARGKYIQFLDADDVLSPDKISAQVAQLEGQKGDEAFAVTRFTRFRVQPGDMPFIAEPSFRDWNSVDLMHYMMTETPGGTQPAGSWLVPRALIERVGPWETRFRISPIDDGAYLYRLLAASATMRFAPQGMLYYRTAIGGMSTVRTIDAVTAMYWSHRTMVAALLGREDSARTRYAAARTFQRFIYDCYPFAPSALLAEAQRLCAHYGGASDVVPEGSPKFHAVRRMLGWKLARRAERLYQRIH